MRNARVQINRSRIKRFWAAAFATIVIFCACGHVENKNTMADDPTKTEAAAPQLPPFSQDLYKFIFESDRFTNEVVPRLLDPAKVAEFLNEKLDEKTTVNQLKQAEKAAAFYDAYEAAEKFKELLNVGGRGEDDLIRRIVLGRTIARIGKPEDIATAAEVYVQTAQRVKTPVEFEQAILFFSTLGSAGDVRPLRQNFEQRLAQLEAQKGGGDQARLEYLKFQETVQTKLNDAERAAGEKTKILRSADRKIRLAEEIKAYLAIDYGFLEFLQPWAASRIRRETWAPEPDRQTVRDPKPELQNDVVTAFRRTLGQLDDFGLSDEEKESAKIQILRAVKFFGGTVDESEEQFLEQFKGTQADTLANEGFLIE